MKGRRDPGCDWTWEIGLAILSARRPLYERLSVFCGLPHPHIYWRSYETLGAFMGVSREAVRLIERKALRKIRCALYRDKHLAAELLSEYGKNAAI